MPDTYRNFASNPVLKRRIILLSCILCSFILLYSVNGGKPCVYDNLKIKLLKVNPELKERDFILFNKYRITVTKNGLPVPSVSNYDIILGFFGFSYSMVHESNDLSSSTSKLENLTLSSLVYEVVRKNYYFLEGADMSSCKIAILNESRALELSHDLFQGTYNQKHQVPVWIIWDIEKQKRFPGSFIKDVTLIDFDDLKNYIENATPATIAEKPVFKAAKPSDPYSPPRINPLFLPAIRSFAKKYLKEQSSYLKYVDPKSLRYSLSSSNEELIIEEANDQSATNGYRIPLLSMSLPVDLQQEQANRRENRPDPEFAWLKQEILNHIEFYKGGQQIFIDDDFQLKIPKIFGNKNGITAISDTSSVKVVQCNLIQENNKQAEKVEIVVSYKKTPLTLFFTNQITGQPIRACKVIIDVVRSPRCAYKGKFFSGKPTQPLFYHNPNVKYRLWIDQPEYFPTEEGKEFSDKDFCNGKTIKLKPRPAFHFYYIDRKAINSSLRDTLLSILQPVFQEKEKFLIYISNSEAPLLISKRENIKTEFNKALYIMPQTPQVEVEKDLILDAIPLDSIPMERFIMLNFIYKIETLTQNEGKLIKRISNHLSSGIMNRKTVITILGDEGLPGRLLEKDYHYIKIID